MGVFSSKVISDALSIHENYLLSRRQCLAYSLNSPLVVSYIQSSRKYGSSSYRGLAYFRTAINMIMRSDYVNTYASLKFTQLSILTAFIVLSLIVLNTLSGGSMYTSGTPTIMVLIILSFVSQMIMLSLMSIQIERQRFRSFGKKVFTTRVFHGENQEY